MMNQIPPTNKERDLTCATKHINIYCVKMYKKTKVQFEKYASNYLREEEE